MAASIPRPSRPSYGPPTSALPALPTTRTRKSIGAIPTMPDSSGFSTPLPKSGLRAPSGGTPDLSASLQKTLPKLRSTPGVNVAGKTIRKTISINAFPQPPRGIVRTSSLPPSPLSAGNIGLGRTSNRDSADLSPLTPGGSLRRKTRPSIGPGSQLNYGSSSSLSLVNGSGTTKSISSGPGARGSDGLLSLPSPPQSRSSSAQDSYSTATTYDDTPDSGRGRNSSGEIAIDGKSPEGKGNVIVSVRVRPDAGGEAPGASKTDGEWMVDGRSSLVAYKGREGGDYYYGERRISERVSRALLISG